MNEAHDHLLFNHLPIIIPIVGILVLMGGILLRSAVVQRTAFFIFVLGAVCTIPAFATGEGAEEVVEHIPGVGHDYIHAHEELAETFALLSYGLGFVSLIGIWASWKKKSFASIISIIVLLFSGIVIYFGSRTGTSGGEIRHTEIRANWKPAAENEHP